MHQPQLLPAFLTRPEVMFGKPICRLGLASHGRTEITADDVLYAVERGVNFLNWAGESEGPDGEDAFRAAIASLGAARDSVAVCIQLGAATADEARRELASVLAALRTEYIDVVTLYFADLTAPASAAARKPTSKLRPSGGRPLRLAERTSAAGLVKEPPRNTRYSPFSVSVATSCAARRCVSRSGA
jgi:hypothetical protein